MNLFAAAADLIKWVVKVLRQCFVVARITTTIVISYSVAARATRMLAFLLPLKVILLAGSEGVPRYFRPFMDPEDKDTGVLALSVAAIICYALTLLLEARIKRLSEIGSDALLSSSGVLMLVSNQRGEAQAFYARFSQVASSILFAAVGLLILAALNPALACYLLGLVIALYLLTAWAVHDATTLKRTRLSDFISDRLGNYLGILSSVAFLSSFLVILYPFIAGTNGNILVAIICVVLLRQMLSAMTSAIKDAVALSRQRHLIDTLVFPDRQFEIVEKKIYRTLRDLFGRQDRKRLIEEELAEFALPVQSFRINWRDPHVRGAADFAIALDGVERQPTRHFLLRVFPPQIRHLAENEELLFSHIERDLVWAPPLLKRFTHGDHECLVWDVGAGRNPGTSRWPMIQFDFLANLWSVEPPPDLVRTYASSHRFLHERLTENFIMRIAVAVDSDREEEILGALLAKLPELRQRLAKLPICLMNPETVSRSVTKRPEGGFYVVGWGQWRLDVLGATVGPDITSRIEDLLELVKRNRIPMHPVVNADDALLAMRCARLETAIIRGQAKSALSHIKIMMREFARKSAL